MSSGYDLPKTQTSCAPTKTAMSTVSFIVSTAIPCLIVRPDKPSIDAEVADWKAVFKAAHLDLPEIGLIGGRKGAAEKVDRIQLELTRGFSEGFDVSGLGNQSSDFDYPASPSEELLKNLLDL